MPSGQYPLIVAGQDFTASLIQSFAPWEAWKTSATSRTTTTQSVDPDLQLTLVPNATYRVTADIIFTGSGGLSFGWTVPSGASGGYTVTMVLAGTGMAVLGYQWTTTAEAGVTGSSVSGLRLGGTLVTSTAGGTFGFNWADFTASDTMTVGVGSALSARRIA